MDRGAELDRESWEERTPSNLDIVGAFAPSDHLQLYHVRNTADETIYVLAASLKYADIIAKMNGHIRFFGNAKFWKTPPVESGSPVYWAIKARIPGVIWMRNDCAVMRDQVFYRK